MSQPESRELSSRERRAFVLRKLHSLTGVLPLGVYLVFHLWTNAKAMQGRHVFEEAVGAIDSVPYLMVVEIVAIVVPLLFHALFGLAIAFEARPNVGRYPQHRNWTYLMQRVTGVALLAFLVYHVAALRLPVLLGTMEKTDFFPTLCDTLSSTEATGVPVVAIVYLLGTAAATYHLAVGLTGFCFSWGITVSQRANRLVAGVSAVLGVLLFAIGASTIIYYATGSRLVFDAPGRDAESPAITCRDTRADTDRATARDEAP